MAVHLPTPKVDLSESILDPDKIPGLGDIRITHPDVTTDFDWHEMVPQRVGFHKTVAIVERVFFDTAVYHPSRGYPSP